MFSIFMSYFISYCHFDCIFEINKQSTVSYKTYRHTAPRPCAMRFLFPESLKFSRRVTTSEPLQQNNMCLNFLTCYIPMLPGTAVNFLQPQNRTHMLRSAWPRSVTFGSTCVCGSACLCIAARSAGRHMKQRACRLVLCCYYVLL